MKMGDEAEIVPPDAGKTLEWITTLAAAGLDYRLSCIYGDWIIHVPREQGAAADAEIAGYERDNADWPPVPRVSAVAASPTYDSWSPLWVCGFLAAFYLWLGPYNGDAPILRAAAADAQATLAGEWWRPITSLTLHAGPTHLAANLLGLLLLGHAVCRVAGGGLGWVLVLVSGVLGNAITAFVVRSDHVSVGSSTALFGALGILSAWRMAVNFRTDAGVGIWNKTWLPVGAGLALLAMLGTGPRSDMAAHVFGFAGGLVLGATVGLCGTSRLPRWAQPGLQMGSLCVVMYAWRVALAAAGSRAAVIGRQ